MHSQNLINSGFAACTPSDTVQVDYDGIYIGGAGNVTVVDSYGNTTLIVAVQGLTLTGKILQVKATGTTATNIVGFLK